jgi:hypothetical protein
MEPINNSTDVIDNVGRMKAIPVSITGIKKFLQIFEDIDNERITRQWTVVEMVRRASFFVGGDDHFGNVR